MAYVFEKYSAGGSGGTDNGFIELAISEEGGTLALPNGMTFADMMSNPVRFVLNSEGQGGLSFKTMTATEDGGTVHYYLVYELVTDLSAMGYGKIAITATVSEDLSYTIGQSVDSGSSGGGGLKLLGTFSEFTDFTIYITFDVGTDIKAKKLFVVVEFANGGKFTFPLFDGSSSSNVAFTESGISGDTYIIFDITVATTGTSIEMSAYSMPSFANVTSHLAGLLSPTITLYELA